MNHDRFDALSGAVMLGEASDAQRAEFAMHAPTCATCRADARCAPVLVRAIDVAREAETWRPRIDRAVLGRIRDSRSSRFRVTIGALGFSIALSIVLNLAFASGLSARFFGFGSTGEPADSGTAMTFSLESPAPRVPVLSTHRSVRVALVPRSKRATHAWNRGSVAAVHRAVAKPSVAADVPVVPDVLAGLDIDGDGDSKHVAVEPMRPCDAGGNEPSAGEHRPVAPCPVSSAADLPH